MPENGYIGDDGIGYGWPVGCADPGVSRVNHLSSFTTIRVQPNSQTFREHALRVDDVRTCAL